MVLQRNALLELGNGGGDRDGEGACWLAPWGLPLYIAPGKNRGENPNRTELATLVSCWNFASAGKVGANSIVKSSTADDALACCCPRGVKPIRTRWSIGFFPAWSRARNSESLNWTLLFTVCIFFFSFCTRRLSAECDRVRCMRNDRDILAPNPNPPSSIGFLSGSRLGKLRHVSKGSEHVREEKRTNTCVLRLSKPDEGDTNGRNAQAQHNPNWELL